MPGLRPGVSRSILNEEDREAQRDLLLDRGKAHRRQERRSENAFRLSCRTVIVAGVALAGTLLSADAAQAKARPCSLVIDEQECCSMEEYSGHVHDHKASAKECKRTDHGKS